MLTKYQPGVEFVVNYCSAANLIGCVREYAQI